MKIFLKNVVFLQFADFKNTTPGIRGLAAARSGLYRSHILPLDSVISMMNSSVQKVYREGLEPAYALGVEVRKAEVRAQLRGLL